ncbi:MAG: hypothetical protein ABI091_06380 [Ferruginibacter sp.]
MIKAGIIARYHIEKSYGIIETLDNESFFFFIDKSSLRRKETKGIHKFRSGDEIEFKIKPDSKHGQIAYNLCFIKNTRRDNLIQEAKELNILKGYLKKIENTFFVKHLSTYLFIPIKISEWETDIGATYEDRLNQLVLFELKNIDKPYIISAILIDRVFKPEYTIINELNSLDQSTFASITGSNTNGFFSSILEGSVEAFISIKMNEEYFKNHTLKKGDVVEAKLIIKHLSPDKGQINLMIIEPIEKPVLTSKSFVFIEEHFGKSIIENKKVSLIERTHGIVVNSLANEIKEKGFLIGNDSNRDLIIHNGNGDIKCIFEIKTSSSTQNIYTAVGQLLLYSISLHTVSGLFIVLPDLLNSKIKEKLEELGIKPIYYFWDENVPKFYNLNQMVSLFR